MVETGGNKTEIPRIIEVKCQAHKNLRSGADIFKSIRPEIRFSARHPYIRADGFTHFGPCRCVIYFKLSVDAYHTVGLEELKKDGQKNGRS